MAELKSVNAHLQTAKFAETPNCFGKVKNPAIFSGDGHQRPRLLARQCSPRVPVIAKKLTFLFERTSFFLH